uniref:Uncharacterized protein n=1 Tax=Romanomermis culicivorax TaxID=13658 RepID=A0A915KKM6_ROMCU
MIDDNLQPNRKEISLSFGNAVSITFRSVPPKEATKHTTAKLIIVRTPHYDASTDRRFQPSSKNDGIK